MPTNKAKRCDLTCPTLNTGQQRKQTQKANYAMSLVTWNNSLYFHSGAKPNVAFYGDGFVCYI